MRIILASGSPRRKAILKKLGYKFDVINPTVREKTSKKLPHKIVQELAFKKAFSVAVMYPDSLIIGGDTLVYCKGKILGKPKSETDALKLLKIENNSWQTVYSGLALICKNKNKLIILLLIFSALIYIIFNFNIKLDFLKKKEVFPVNEEIQALRIDKWIHRLIDF